VPFVCILYYIYESTITYGTIIMSAAHIEIIFNIMLDHFEGSWCINLGYFGDYFDFITSSKHDVYVKKTSV